MNALLVYPEFLTTFWSWKHLLKFVAKKSAFPPLGLLTIAAMLPEFWEKRIVDLNDYDKEPFLFRKKAKEIVEN